VGRATAALTAAYFRVVVAFFAWLEEHLFRSGLVEGLEPNEYDIFLILGIGTVNSELEGALTRWARHNGVPQIHIIGNYDHPTSKGFRGLFPERLLVWGPQMLEDLVHFHDIPSSRISLIGSIRYNSIEWASLPDRSTFLPSLGLDPAKKTIVFAGFVYVSQYFEMLNVYQRLLAERVNCQLILRLYPNKVLLNSVYIGALIGFTQLLPNTYISCADPHFKDGDRNKEVLQVEENELWPMLHNCDVLIDFYSTIVLEGAIFDKPCIHMHYVPKTPGAYYQPAVPVSYWDLRHNKRLMSYGAVDVVNSRDELVDQIKTNFAEPERYAEARRTMVARECGSLDGYARDRLIHECESMLLASYGHTVN
jgi:hypothetical protein